jgi:hypothetical protein
LLQLARQNQSFSGRHAQLTARNVPSTTENPGQNDEGDLAPVSPDTQAVAVLAAMNSRGERIVSPECGWFSL